MKRFVLPFIGLIAALWAFYSIARTTPQRETTNPPNPPPVSAFQNTVAAVGLIEASTENISVGTPLSGVVAKVFVTAGQSVRSGDPLFELDLRNLRAELKVRTTALHVARARLVTAQSHLQDLQRQYEFVKQVSNTRAISEQEESRRRFAVEIAAGELEEAKAQIASAESQLNLIRTEMERSIIRSPIDAEVLQVKVRPSEFAQATTSPTPLVLLGKSKPLHVRVDIDEHEAWRVRSGAKATGHVRGNSHLKSELSFVRFEPFVIPKESLTGDSTERVDTRVLQVLYRVERDDIPLFVGQQLDVFIEAQGRYETK
ncbi:HlyD family efflux transporter periplasmic adaptor subunit [bacterium]|nr:HlyD family efflux transporter periplasmic adaptor subunit [bacterium]